MSVSMSLGGDIRSLNRHLQKLGNVDYEGLNQSIAESLRTSTRLRFRSGVGPDDKPWKRSLRANDMKKGKTLVETARLRNSIRGRATKELAEVGTNVIYAARHQFGDKQPMVIKAKKAKALRFKVGGRWVSKKQVTVQLPARPYLGINEDDREEIKSIMETCLEEAGR